MVQRINFIEKGAYTLTYRNMLVFAGLVCVFCIAVYGVFALRLMLVKSKAAGLKKEVQELSIQKEKTLAALQIAQTQTGSVAPLAALFAKPPVWSSVLSNIVNTMPKQVWLKEVRSTSVGEAVDKRKIEISGRSVSHASIAQFVSSLESSEWFENMALVNSQKDVSGYSFLVSGEVLFPASAW